MVCAYDPVGFGVPYNHLMFADHREPVVEVASQILVVTLDHDTVHSQVPSTVDAADEGNEVRNQTSIKYDD